MELEVLVCPGSVANVGSLLVERNASNEMSPPLMARMLVGPWGVNAN